MRLTFEYHPLHRPQRREPLPRLVSDSRTSQASATYANVFYESPTSVDSAVLDASTARSPRRPPSSPSVKTATPSHLLLTLISPFDVVLRRDCDAQPPRLYVPPTSPPSRRRPPLSLRHRQSTALDGHRLRQGARRPLMDRRRVRPELRRLKSPSPIPRRPAISRSPSALAAAPRRAPVERTTRVPAARGRTRCAEGWIDDGMDRRGPGELRRASPPSPMPRRPGIPAPVLALPAGDDDDDDDEHHTSPSLPPNPLPRAPRREDQDVRPTGTPGRLARRGTWWIRLRPTLARGVDALRRGKRWLSNFRMEFVLLIRRRLPPVSSSVLGANCRPAPSRHPTSTGTLLRILETTTITLRAPTPARHLPPPHFRRFSPARGQPLPKQT
ncbi:hypothetical protein FB451DRAFT_1170772 [Mycena latifolia]|nr:hypothetical protein FB451DRAFT_1170772 [Mycena latifolia]